MTKRIPIRWTNIVLGRIIPDVYPRYYRRQAGFAQLVPGHHFFNDEAHSWCEFFFEKINSEFWLQAMEIRAKDNNHYIFEDKKGSGGYSSINILSSGGSIGYRDHEDLHWANSHVIFSKPGTSSDVYLEKGQILKCCRLIFTESYLTELSQPGFTPKEEEEVVLSEDKVVQSPLFRMASTAEIFLQNRLFNILKYERKKQHYKSSVFSILFELTAFFLNSPLIKKLPPMLQ